MQSYYQKERRLSFNFYFCAIPYLFSKDSPLWFLSHYRKSPWIKHMYYYAIYIKWTRYCRRPANIMNQLNIFRQFITYPCWRHQMEIFSALLALVAGNLPVTGEFPSRRPVTRSFDIFFDLRLNVWVNNREANDLRSHRAYYAATVMVEGFCFTSTA